MTNNVTSPAPVAPADPFVVEMQRILADVSKNSAQVEFPRDIHGMTSELRKAGLRAASSIRGNEDKQKLFLGTLQVLAQHAKARFADDQIVTAQRAEMAARVVRAERVYGTPVPAPKTEAAVPMK